MLLQAAHSAKPSTGLYTAHCVTQWLLRGRNKLPPLSSSSCHGWGRYQTQASLKPPIHCYRGSTTSSNKPGEQMGILHSFSSFFSLPLHWNIEPRSTLDDPEQTKIFCQGDPRTSLEKCIAFCWYYLRTKINVFRKVCIRVKGINWKVKEGEGGEGACHISSKKPHCRKISQERSLPMHSPASDRKSKIQSCATL